VSAHLAIVRRRQRGVAFVLVLWVIAMLSILLGSFALVARTENLQSRHLFDTTQARYAAEAGLNLAIYELRKADPMQRWIADGRPYRFGYGDAEIEIAIQDDSGKIDINTAMNNGDLLTNLFVTHGVPLDQAQALADAVKDWIDSDDLKSPNGAEAADYKAAERAKIEAQGYTIIANVGDQPSDLAGGHALRGFLLPNPFYRIP